MAALNALYFPPLTVLYWTVTFSVEYAVTSPVISNIRHISIIVHITALHTNPSLRRSVTLPTIIAYHSLTEYDQA